MIHITLFVYWIWWKSESDENLNILETCFYANLLSGVEEEKTYEENQTISGT